MASTSSSRDSLAQSVAEQSQVTTGGGGGGGGGYDLITAALGLGLWAAFAGERAHYLHRLRKCNFACVSYLWLIGSWLMKATLPIILGVACPARLLRP